MVVGTGQLAKAFKVFDTCDNSGIKVITHCF